MNDSRTIIPPLTGAHGEVHLQGSKSIANRALPLAALGKGTVCLKNLPSGDDVLIMKRALEKLGTKIQVDGSDMKITGKGEPFSVQKKVSLHLGNSGTATRFLTAILAACNGIFELDGIPRLRERPIGDLVDALGPLSCSPDDAAETEGKKTTGIQYLLNPGYPPLRIEAKGLLRGRTCVKGDTSSQFLSGLLMALPLCRNPATISLEGELVSRPYVSLTLDILKQFSVEIENSHFREFLIKSPQGYQNPKSFTVEADPSSASYFLAAGAIAGKSVTVHGVGSRTLQYSGEGAFANILKKMGAKVAIGTHSITVSHAPLQGIEANMNTMSDTGMTLAVLSLFAKGKTHISGIGNWRVKETDRIHAMATELRKLGATVDEDRDSLTIIPPSTWKTAEIETYDDHRMAMSFSLGAFAGIPVTILNPQCVNKTFPDYFKVFSDITVR
jgi:3-phosphoshikimate 1-carboxyvinyltransferase